MAHLRQRVITIHGVNPDRAWQIAARSVLEPHFEYIGIDYHGYDGIGGPVRVVCYPLALGVSVLALIVSVVAAAGGDWRVAAISAAAGGGRQVAEAS
jgi:hypothetical protein